MWYSNKVVKEQTKPEYRQGAATKQNVNEESQFRVDDPARYQTFTSDNKVPHSHKLLVDEYPPDNDFINTDLIGAKLLGSNEYVNDSARLFNPFDETPMGDPLYKSFGGRLMTQTVARGLFGAAFFAAGSYMIKEYEPGVKWDDQKILGKPLRTMEWLLDSTLTKGLTKTLEVTTDMTPDQVQEFMRFDKMSPNDTMLKHAQSEASTIAAAGIGDPTVLNNQVLGRTWGQEMVERTWSFASGSIGASVGRNVVALLDPNHKTSWLRDGNVDFKDLVESSAKEAFHIMSYNQMEDWFAAPFYTWQLRAGRAAYDNGLINRTVGEDSVMSDLQTGTNGAARRVDLSPQDDGTVKATMGDSFAGAGAMDYQTRFMGYNFYTLVFRDLYNHTGHWMGDGCPVSLELPENPLGTAVHNASETGKYLVKSLTKSAIYMAPAVLAFWPQRIGAAKGSHSLVNAQDGTVITTQPTHGFDVANPTDTYLQHSTQTGTYLGAPAGKDVIAKVSHINQHVSDMNNGVANPVRLYSGTQEIKLELENGASSYNPYTDTHSSLDRGMGVIGQGAEKYKSLVNNTIAQPTANFLKKFDFIDSGQVNEDAQFIANSFADCGISYLPYMTAKYETANLWDTPLMDAAAYRMADGLFGLNPSEFWSGIKDIKNVVTFQPLSEETQKHVGEKRGLINSRYEASERKAHSQEKIRHDHDLARLKERIEKGEPVAIARDQPPVQHPEPPTTTVADMSHSGSKIDGQAIHIKHMRPDPESANDIVAFTRKNPVNNTENSVWADYASKDKDKERDPSLSGVTIH